MSFQVSVSYPAISAEDLGDEVVNAMTMSLLGWGYIEFTSHATEIVMIATPNENFTEEEGFACGAQAWAMTGQTSGPLRRGSVWSAQELTLEQLEDTAVMSRFLHGEQRPPAWDAEVLYDFQSRPADATGIGLPVLAPPGTALTDEIVQSLADEAEAGYDIDRIKERTIEK